MKLKLIYLKISVFFFIALFCAACVSDKQAINDFPQLRHFVVHSNSLSKDMRISVYLPEGFQGKVLTGFIPASRLQPQRG